MALLQIDKEQIEQNNLGGVQIRRRYRAGSRSEALTGVPPLVDGLPISSKSAQPWLGDAGPWIVDAVYEGVIEDPDPEQDVFEIRTEEREQKLVTFEPREKLVEEYGAIVGEADGAETLTFPATLPGPPTRMGQPLTLSNRGSGPAERPNPLYGATSFPVFASVAIWRLVRKRVPQSLQRQSGSLIDKLPSGFEYNGPAEMWWVRPLQVRKTGNAWEIEWTALEISKFPDLEALAGLQASELLGGARRG